MAPRIISRRKAIALGRKWYFTGKPCKHGHIAKRTLAGNCFECRRIWHHGEWHLERSRAWYWENRERVLDGRKIYYKKNKNGSIATYRRKKRGSILAQRKGYRLANTEVIHAYHREWKRENALRCTVLQHNREARKRANGGSHTIADIEALFVRQNGCCAGCAASIKKRFEIDHKRPISRGGNNAPRNLQLLCPSCNRSKKDKTTSEWKRRKLE